MKFFKKMKDGGAESTVTGYFLIEIKWLFTIVLLRFDGKSRTAFHSHAFNCLNWLLKGKLIEERIMGLLRAFNEYYVYEPSLKPFIIRREDTHKVDSVGVSWVLSFRGLWTNSWKEIRPLEGSRIVTLTHGRKEVHAGVA